MNHINRIRRPLHSIRLLTAAVILFSASVPAALKEVTTTAVTDTTISVWVTFTDKATGSSSLTVLPKTRFRRHAAGFVANGTSDLPIAAEYIRSVERCGGTLRSSMKWENAASFNLPVRSISAVKRLPFVRTVSLVGSGRKTGSESDPHLEKRASTLPTNYGLSAEYLAMLDVPAAHRYVTGKSAAAAPGTGVRIAFFDSGFRLRHRCFRHLFARNAIIGMHDFVDGDDTVEDPDSVFNDRRHPYYQNDFHGSLVMSLVAAYDPPYMCGDAWGAEFLLARTEDSFEYGGYSREVHAEEDNWAAAVVWAESLGVDIISSSVAYRSDFEDTVIIHREDGHSDTIYSYSRSDMDGKTTIVSRAAREAIRRGVIIVNSVGNEGNEGDTSLDAPSDVDGVIAVGMVDNLGRIDPLSSRGPTADGRIKPDVVAPGSAVTMPNVYSYDDTTSYIIDGGSSFSAPLVTGICALIRQADTSLDGDAVRTRLYRYCRLPQGHTAADNQYGRGIPDALLSCMRPNEVWLSATDTGNAPLRAATIEDEHGTALAQFDSAGTALFTIPSGSSSKIIIRNGSLTREVTFSMLPCEKALLPCSLTVFLADTNGQAIPYAPVTGTVGATDFTKDTDDEGSLIVASFFHTPVVLYAEQYPQSDTLRISLTDTLTHAVLHTGSENVTVPDLVLFPTVIHTGRGESLHLRCTIPATMSPPQFEAVVRTVNGELVWKCNRRIDTPVADNQWNCTTRGGGKVSPGTYLVATSFNGKKKHRKIIIVP